MSREPDLPDTFGKISEEQVAKIERDFLKSPLAFLAEATPDDKLPDELIERREKATEGKAFSPHISKP